MTKKFKDMKNNKTTIEIEIKIEGDPITVAFEKDPNKKFIKINFLEALEDIVDTKMLEKSQIIKNNQQLKITYDRKYC
jgi:hypothetical protein